jgi:ribosomal protein L37AE/L43A
MDSALCPKCGRRSHTRGDGKDVWYCHDCSMYFEAIEDGDISYGPPDRRINREERRLQSQGRRR